MGVYAGQSSTAPTNKTSYAWVKYIGEDGQGTGAWGGIAGKPFSSVGSDGLKVASGILDVDPTKVVLTTGNAATATNLQTWRTLNQLATLNRWCKIASIKLDPAKTFAAARIVILIDELESVAGSMCLDMACACGATAITGGSCEVSPLFGSSSLWSAYQNTFYVEYAVDTDSYLFNIWCQPRVSYRTFTFSVLHESYNYTPTATTKFIRYDKPAYTTNALTGTIVNASEPYFAGNAATVTAMSSTVRGGAKISGTDGLTMDGEVLKAAVKGLITSENDFNAQTESTSQAVDSFILKEILDDIIAGGGGGIAPSNVANIVAKAGDGLVRLTWQDPNDTYVDGNLLCTWQGTKVVYKTDSYPTSATDGTLAVDSTARNAYSDTPLTITGLTNDTPYYFAFFPYSDQGVVNKNIANRITATPQAYVLFGYYDDTTDSNPETKIHYIEMNENFTPARMVAAGGWTEGSWTEEAAWFIKNNKPYMVKYDGTIDYELCHTDYSKKIDSTTASDVANTSYAGNAMASIPLIWVKRYTENNKKYHLFCNIQLTEDFHAYAHTRSDGTIEPYTWFPLFGGSLVSSKCRSIAGQTQMNTQTGTDEITYCKANGSLWNTGYWSAFMLRCELETLLTRSTNKQDSCGYGNYTGGSAAASLLKTGTQLTGGRFFGYGSTVNKARKFLHCEWQMGAWERINGLLYVSGAYRVKQYEPYNETGADYISTGLSISGTSGNYISAGTLNDNGEFPTALSGSSDTYYCCGVWYDATQVDHALVDGACDNGLSCGGAVDVSLLVSRSYWNISARPYCKTPTTAQASDIED